jgi:transposase-like protein
MSNNPLPVMNKELKSLNTDWNTVTVSPEEYDDIRERRSERLKVEATQATEKNLAKAVKAVIDGGEKIFPVSKRYGVNYATLKNHVVAHREGRKVTNGRPPLLSPEEVQNLTDERTIEDASKCSLHPQELRKKLADNIKKKGWRHAMLKVSKKVSTTNRSRKRTGFKTTYSSEKSTKVLLPFP